MMKSIKQWLFFIPILMGGMLYYACKLVWAMLNRAPLYRAGPAKIDVKKELAEQGYRQFRISSSEIVDLLQKASWISTSTEDRDGIYVEWTDQGRTKRSDLNQYGHELEPLSAASRQLLPQVLDSLQN